jgi:hypothetical protein
MHVTRLFCPPLNSLLPRGAKGELVRPVKHCLAETPLLPRGAKGELGRADAPLLPSPTKGRRGSWGVLMPKTRERTRGLSEKPDPVNNLLLA